MKGTTARNPMPVQEASVALLPRGQKTPRPQSQAYPPHVALRPNPSFEARPNGKPPGPGRWYGVHFHRPGPGGLPLVPPQLER